MKYLVLCILHLDYYYTEGVFMSPGGTGCINSTLFDAHIQWHWFSAVSVTSIVSPYKNTYNSYMHIFSIFGSLYHINSEIDMHILSIFGRLYHINSETDMDLFSIFSRKYHIFLCTLFHLAGYFLNLFLFFTWPGTGLSGVSLGWMRCPSWKRGEQRIRSPRDPVQVDSHFRFAKAI